MIRKMLTGIILLGLNWPSFSQNMEEQLRLKDDIAILNNRINKLLKKDPVLTKIYHLQIYHIFWLEYEGEFTKENFLSLKFLDRLIPYYYTSGILCKKKYLQTETVICDSSYNLIAQGNAQRIFTTCKYNKNYLAEEKAFQILIHEKEVSFVFCIGYTPNNIYFGIGDQTIYVFNFTKEGIQVLSLEEFINCSWDEFIQFRKSMKMLNIHS